MLKKLCKESGCDRPARAIGLCTLHYNRLKPIKNLKKCSVENCVQLTAGKNGVCKEHYQEFLRNGTIKSYERDPIEIRFKSKYKVDLNTDCWNWTASKDDCGYGYFLKDGRPHRAHRISYEFHKGPIPEGIEVCHTCDNPPCVNPDHLFLGTHKVNMGDMVNKGRSKGTPGEAHNKAKLTDEKVLEIRRLFNAGYSESALVKKFKVCQSTINRVILRQTWSHVKEPEPEKLTFKTRVKTHV
jgi:hypothetical protein